MEWLEQENLNNVKRMLKYQKLEKFLNLIGNLYPDLVRVLFTNLCFEDDIMCFHEKGVDMVITDDVWIVVIGLKSTGKVVDKGNIASLEEFNKV